MGAVLEPSNSCFSYRLNSLVAAILHSRTLYFVYFVSVVYVHKLRFILSLNTIELFIEKHLIFLGSFSRQKSQQSIGTMENNEFLGHLYSDPTFQNYYLLNSISHYKEAVYFHLCGI